MPRTRDAAVRVGSAFERTAEVRADARRIQLAFGSDEYFKLLISRPDIQPWLSVGANVQLILDDTIYEIVPET